MKIQTKEEAAREVMVDILAFIIAVPIVGAMLTWYNHIFTASHFAYWQWCAMSIPLKFLCYRSKVLQAIATVAFAITLLSQVAAWVGIISLPLLKP